jgi:hypothetical protein
VARSGDRQQEVTDVAGGGSSGRWSRWPLQQLPMDAGSKSSVRRPPPPHAPQSGRGCRLSSASPRSSPTSLGRRMEDVPFPGIVGHGSVGCRHELNHGGQTTQILAWLPRPWVLHGHQEVGHHGSIPAGSRRLDCRCKSMAWSMAVQIHHLASHAAHSQPPHLPHQLNLATVAI